MFLLLEHRLSQVRRKNWQGNQVHGRHRPHMKMFRVCLLEKSSGPHGEALKH